MGDLAKYMVFVISIAVLLGVLLPIRREGYLIKSLSIILITIAMRIGMWMFSIYPALRANKGSTGTFQASLVLFEAKAVGSASGYANKPLQQEKKEPLRVENRQQALNPGASTNMPTPQDPNPLPEHGGEVILTSSLELFNGLILKDGGDQLIQGPCRIIWHRYGWTRHKDAQMDGWAPMLPCGVYSIRGTDRRVVQFSYSKVKFRYPGLPAYGAVVRLIRENGQEEINSWPEGFRGILNPAIFGDEKTVGIADFYIPKEIAKIILTVNAPVDRQLEWKSDQGSIVLEVVK